MAGAGFRAVTVFEYRDRHGLSALGKRVQISPRKLVCRGGASSAIRSGNRVDKPSRAWPGSDEKPEPFWSEILKFGVA